MKKSKIVIAAGAFIALTLFLGIQKDDTKMYEKQKMFSSSTEILEQLNDKTIRTYNIANGKYEVSPDILECFSQRKRLTSIDLNGNEIEINSVIELTDDQQKAIIDEYNKLKQSYSKRKPVSKTEAVRIKVQPYYRHYSEDGEETVEPRDHLIYMNLVLIDEGEGMVIDYISETDEQDVIEG